MNHASEIFHDLRKYEANHQCKYSDLRFTGSKTERRYVTTTDGKKMLVWVILPPNFDAKKYPTLLYCQGGPQSALTNSILPLNFQLMAANGYIVVAPNRRGMPGHGGSGMSKSKVGQVMDDYLQLLTTSLKKVMLTTPA
jgi:dipeptidyl aminopeptidase/acylaminoacyl peptidase